MILTRLQKLQELPDVFHAETRQKISFLGLLLHALLEAVQVFLAGRTAEDEQCCRTLPIAEGDVRLNSANEPRCCA